MSKFDEMRQAVNEARWQIDAADRCVDQMADLIIGRLRSGKVSGRSLKALKKELRNFNIHTGLWRDE